MRRAFLGATLSVALLAASAGAAPRPWPAGEQLRFRLTFGPLTAGEAVLRADGPVTHGGRPCWRLSAEVVTGATVSSLYRVRDRLESVADTTDLRCLQSRISLHEGGYRERFEAVLDHDAAIAKDQRGRRLVIPVGCHDVLAAWYRARTLALAPGDTAALPVLAGRRLGHLRLAVSGRDTVTTPAGPRACLVVTASLEALAPERAGREARIWVSEDRDRLPLRIEIAAPLGRIVATLVAESEAACDPAPRRP